MGESFLRKQRRRFTHLTDVAYDNVTAPDLVRAARPDVFVREFACRTTPGVAPLRQGAACRLQLSARGDIDVFVGHRIVGSIDDSDRTRLADTLAQAGGQANCTVTRTAAFTEFFSVRLDPDEASGSR